MKKEYDDSAYMQLESEQGLVNVARPQLLADIYFVDFKNRLTPAELSMISKASRPQLIEDLIEAFLYNT